MLSLTLDPPTWLHRLPAGAKLAALAATTVVVLPVTNPVTALGIVAAVGVLYASCGWVALARLRLLRPLIPLLAILLIAQGLLDGWGFAIAVVARIVSLVALANLVTMTTRLDDMLDAIAFLVAPLRFVGLAPRTLALAVALVIRFTPLLLSEWQALSDAYRARTGRRPGVRLLAPFTIRMLDIAEHVGEALAARHTPTQDRRNGNADSSVGHGTDRHP